MNRYLIKRGLGAVVILFGWLAASLLSARVANAQQGIDLFEGKQGVERTQNLVIESGQTGPAEGEAGLSTLQIDYGRSGVSTTHGGQALRLAFDRFGSSIRVKAKVQGREVYFLLDTGATYSTLTPEFAKSVGITPTEGNPTTTSQTANGMVLRTFGIIPRLELGDRMHSKVSFTLCESCGGDNKEHPIVGLLGLNVLRRYRMTVDDERGMVELVPQGGFSNQRDDIMPWIEMGFHEKIVSEGKINPTGHVLKVKNLSAHAMQDIEIGWRCDVAGREGFDEVLKVSKLKPRGSSEVKLPPPPAHCGDHQLLLQNGHW